VRVLAGSRICFQDVWVTHSIFISYSIVVEVVMSCDTKKVGKIRSLRSNPRKMSNSCFVKLSLFSSLVFWEKIIFQIRTLFFFCWIEQAWKWITGKWDARKRYLSEQFCISGGKLSPVQEKQSLPIRKWFGHEFLIREIPIQCIYMNHLASLAQNHAKFNKSNFCLLWFNCLWQTLPYVCVWLIWRF